MTRLKHNGTARPCFPPTAAQAASLRSIVFFGMPGIPARLMAPFDKLRTGFALLRRSCAKPVKRCLRLS